MDLEERMTTTHKRIRMSEECAKLLPVFLLSIGALLKWWEIHRRP